MFRAGSATEYRQSGWKRVVSLVKRGEAPALPGRQPQFDNSGNRNAGSKRSGENLSRGETVR